MPGVAFYISGHGFGHASRQIEVINALGAMAPDTRIVVRTSAPRWLFDRTARVPITLLTGECDTGIVQIDSLRLDAPETVRRARAFYRTLDERATAEAALLRQHGITLVVSDAPPLGCAAAAAAGIPSVVISNFTWDWIYEAYLDDCPGVATVLPSIRDAYARADKGWRLPMYGGFATFAQLEDAPFVARHATHARDEVRTRLGLDPDARLVLSSFGGYGVQDVDLERLDCLPDYRVIVTLRDGEPPPAASGVQPLAETDIYGRGLRYEDLVAAVDIVLSKPGYGIISECIANGTALVYTSRGRFVEYDVLVAEMPRYLRCAYLDHAALFAGRWRAALDDALSQPAPPIRPRTDGAITLGSDLDFRSRSDPRTSSSAIRQ